MNRETMFKGSPSYHLGFRNSDTNADFNIGIRVSESDVVRWERSKMLILIELVNIRSEGALKHHQFPFRKLM